MSDISQIEVHGTVYDVKDTTARADSSIQSDWSVTESRLQNNVERRQVAMKPWLQSTAFISLKYNIGLD